ncbi:unnamed protein product [Caenorhabditis sp. 36 PRJEB53466]|nr:unnamed protein product [Caenorhabditis sp. 36 PRJEB53466]
MRNLLQTPLNMPDDVAGAPNPAEGKRNNNGRNRGQGFGGNRGREGNNNNPGRRPPSNRQNQRPQNTKVDMKKYERMISAAHTNFSDIPCGRKTADCDICCKPNDVFGIGACRHPICVECAIRMRVLGDSKTCPVCRSEIDVLSFCTVDEDMASIPLTFRKTTHPDEDRFEIRFNNQVSGTKYEKYLAHVCKICKTEDGERLEFPSFMSLRQHMANRHELSYCHICTDNLNLFSRERKTYTREQLQRHMKSGDFDDRSFKGHPQCLFCDEKFLDEENRYRHLRKEHFFCQFCESDGTMTNVFFGKHDELKRHYKENHFICEAEECKQMGIALPPSFGQRPSNADTGRPMGRGRGARGGHHNEPAPPVPRERIALVQRQVETNPQSDPSEFTTVRSAQSKGTFTSTRSAFTTSTQDFPSLGPQAAPPPSIRSSDFPRLNKVNKPTSAAAAAAAPVVEHFPTLGDSAPASAPPLRIKVPPLAKRRQPPPPAPPQPRAKPARQQQQQQPKEEDSDYVPRRDVPQAVVKVNNALLRFDTVDDRVTPAAKSNVRMVQRVDQNPPSSSASSSGTALGRFDFPALPAASAPMLPANSSWLNSKNSKVKSGVISSVTVPTNYSKAIQNQGKKKNKVNVPKTEVWSSLGRAPEASVASAPVDTWQTIKLSKEAQAEKEKKERKEEWARKKAEEKADKAAARAAEQLEASESDAEPITPKTPPVTIASEPDWQTATSRASEAAKAAEAAASAKKNKKNKKKAEEALAPVAAPSEPTPAATLASAPLASKSPAQVESPVTSASTPAAESVKDSYQEKMDAFWNMPKLPSMTSMFSSFSLSGMLGRGASSNAPTPTTPPTRPPGFGDIVFTPPPGLGFPTEKKVEDISFASAPILSHDDVKEKRERMELQRQKEKEEAEKEDDGWATTGKPKANGKNKKKK